MRSTIIYFIIAPTSLAFFFGLIASLSKNLSKKDDKTLAFFFWLIASLNKNLSKKDDKTEPKQS